MPQKLFQLTHIIVWNFNITSWEKKWLQFPAINKQ